MVSSSSTNSSTRGGALYRFKGWKRRLVGLAVLGVARAIDWGETTSSTSYEIPYEANVGEILTIQIPPNEKATIDFISDPSDYFSVSYRQCSESPAQPLQMQYAGVLHYEPYVGGCIYQENEDAGIGLDGCTFWQYNPAETWHTTGNTYEDSEPIDAGRARFENQGSENATVDIVMFSSEVTTPVGIVDHNVWIEDGFTKKDRVVNTSVNVYFNKDNNYCDTYGCTVNGWVNEYVEGQDSLSLCEVQATGEIYHEDVSFETWIPLTFTLPETGEYYVTLILTAREHRMAVSNITEMQEYGLDQVVVFQTDTTLSDSSARILAGFSLATVAWVILLNTLLAGVRQGGGLWQGGRGARAPTLGW